MNLSNYQKILIIRLSSLGDILLTTPLVRTIKKQYPHISIEFIARKEYEDTIKFNPYISNIISLSRDYRSEDLNKEIKRNNYNLIIDLQNNIRSRRLTKGVSSTIVRYKKPYLNRLLLVKLKINRFQNITPIPVRYANSIPEFNLDEKGLELFLSENLEIILEDNHNYIGFCPGSRHITKMWPEEYFVELGNELTKKNYTVVLFGGKDDKEVCAKISKQINGSVDLSNDNDLLDLAANMKKCSAIICNDSGLMHTALAVQVPVIAIFGSTVKEFGFTPYKGKNLILENNSLSCRPCSHIGLDECPKKHFKCLTEITPNFVFQKTINFIETL